MSATSYFRSVAKWIWDAARTAVWRLWYARHGICGAAGMALWCAFVKLGMPADKMAAALDVSEAEIWNRLALGAIRGDTGLRHISNICSAMGIEPEFSFVPKEAAA